jgi:hypothetical protein
MAIFDRNYDRGYGYRGNPRSGYGARGGYDRDSGGRGEGTWESMKRNTREFFGMDNRYDRGYGYDRDMNSTYNNRGTWGAGGYGRDFRQGGTTAGYGRDYAGRSSTGGYDRPYWGYDTPRYGEDYKSREQTDAGDPFADRQSGTPIRVIDEPRDRGWFGRDRDNDRSFRYGRDHGAGRAGYGKDYYAANPMGYDPYNNRGGDTQRLGRTYDAGYRRRNYDQDWF